MEMKIERFPVEKGVSVLFPGYKDRLWREKVVMWTERVLSNLLLAHKGLVVMSLLSLSSWTFLCHFLSN